MTLSFSRTLILSSVIGVAAFAGVLAARSNSPQIIPQQQRVCPAKTPSGLGYKMLKPGNGAAALADSYVQVNYLGYFAKTGAIFDQSPSAIFPVRGVVPGFSEGLKLMKQGGVHRLCIPSRLGYGADGVGPIPPNSDLVFQVKLIKVMTREEAQAAQSALGQ